MKKTIEELREKISDINHKIVGEHFKYNRMGKVVDDMKVWAKHDIDYAREVLDRIELGENPDDMISELAELQYQTEVKLNNEKEELEKQLKEYLC